MVDESEFHSPVRSTSAGSVVRRAAARCREEGLPPSVDQCRTHALQFPVHFVDLLTVLLCGNRFTRIQEAVVDETGCKQSQ